jgi:hypothetical protein
MAAVGDVPDVAWQKVAMSTWHCGSLEARFRCQKAASKPFKDAFYAMLVCEINKFPWSDNHLAGSFERP